MFFRQCRARQLHRCRSDTYANKETRIDVDFIFIDTNMFRRFLEESSRKDGGKRNVKNLILSLKKT